MTYVPTTEEVRFDATFYDGMGGPITVEGFNMWLASIWNEAFEQGMAKEGAGGGDIEQCPYI